MCDSGNKTAASAHGMRSGGLAVDAMTIGCLGIDRCGERFFVLDHFLSPVSLDGFFCLGYTLLKSFCLGVIKFKSPENGRTVQFVWLGHFLRFIHRMG
jgi:hypothetical protein